MKKITGFFLLVIVLLFSACRSKTGLESILLASECMAPCWIDITPGITTKEETISMLKQKPEIIDPDSIFINTEQSEAYFGWTFVNSDLVGYVSFRGEKVASIIIGDWLQNRGRFGIRLDRMIETYGEPTDVYYTVGGGDAVVFRIILVNRNKGILAEYSQNAINKINISTKQKIERIIFFDPVDYPDNLFKNLSIDISSSNHFDWSGFGQISLP
jgi:hypothetical protein